VEQFFVVTVNDASRELFFVSRFLQLLISAYIFCLFRQSVHLPVQILDLVLNDLRVLEAAPVDDLNPFIYDEGVRGVADLEQPSLLHEQLAIVSPTEHSKWVQEVSGALRLQSACHKVNRSTKDQRVRLIRQHEPLHLLLQSAFVFEQDLIISAQLQHVE
jgi:hypothetical protein